MNRERITLAQEPQLRMRSTSSAHIVLGMDLKEADRLLRRCDRPKMLRLEACSRAGGEPWDAHRPFSSSLALRKKAYAHPKAPRPRGSRLQAGAFWGDRSGAAAGRLL